MVARFGDEATVLKLARLLEEPDVVRTGISAAADVGADIVAPADLEAYAPAARFDELRDRYFLD